MLKFSKKILLLFLVLISTSGCIEKKTISTDDKPDPFLLQSEREILKAKKNGIKTTHIYSFFRLREDIKIEKGKEAERIYFNESGKRTKHLKFRGNGDIELEWIYKYDELGNVISVETFDQYGKKIFTKESKYDGSKEIERIETHNKKRLTKYHITLDYDENGNMVSYKKMDSLDNILLTEEHIFDEKNRKLKRIGYNSEGKNIGEIVFSYDSLDQLIKTEQIIDDSVYYVTSSSFDDKGNLIEVLNAAARYEYKSNGNRDIIEQAHYLTNGSRQALFKYEYSSNGLLHKKTRFDSDDKPILFVTYEYEFY